MSLEGPFLARLHETLAAWQREGLITAGQARRILAYHGLAPDAFEETRGNARLVSILGILGATLVGIGIILFVASNWPQLDRLQKVALLLATLVSLYGAGYWLKYEPGNYRRIGEALIFLATIVLGANIFLIAQLYHVPAGEPSLLAFWSLGAFATAYATASRPAIYLAILAALGWYSLQLAAWGVDEMGTAGIIGLAAFVPYGLMILGLGELQRSFSGTRPLSTAFTSLGLLVGLAPIWLFTFADFWRELIRGASSAGEQVSASAVAQLNTSFALFTALALLLALASVWRRRFSRASIVQAAGVLLLCLSSLIVVFHPFQDAGVYAAIFNALLLAAVLWSVVVGLWTGRESFINLGVAFFVLLVTARYFDLFFSFMDRSLVFISAGALLLAGGYLLERSRRRLLRGMREGGEAADA